MLPDRRDGPSQLGLESGERAAEAANGLAPEESCMRSLRLWKLLSREDWSHRTSQPGGQFCAPAEQPLAGTRDAKASDNRVPRSLTRGALCFLLQTVMTTIPFFLSRSLSICRAHPIRSRMAAALR